MSGEWRLRAACRDADPDAPFGTEPEQALFAAAYCTDCPVVHECLQLGIAHDAEGVWGGLTRRRRHRKGWACQRVPRKRGPARWASDCGTTAGYRRHLVAKEQTCPSCRRAWSEYASRRAAA